MIALAITTWYVGSVVAFMLVSVAALLASRAARLRWLASDLEDEWRGIFAYAYAMPTPRSLPPEGR